MKTCTKCAQPKALDQFYTDRAKRDMRDSWCKACRNQARMQKYYVNHQNEKQRARDYYREVIRPDPSRLAVVVERRRRYYADNREAILARERGRPGKRQTRDPAKERIRYMKRHGGIDEWARMWDAQDGCCYLCGQTLEGVPQKQIAVDHDHDCCPGGRITESCDACRRGLTHAWCNQLIGLAGEDMDVLRAIIANFERVNVQTKQRIAAKPHAQGELDLGLAG